MLKITGLEEFQRKLEQMRRNAEQLDGQHQVALTDLFPPAFMRRHTSVADFEAFCREGEIDASTPQAFADMSPTRMDEAVQRLTGFGSWEDMKRAGAADWARRRLFDDLPR